MQSKGKSLAEACTNTFSRMGINFCAGFFIYPILGMGGGPQQYAAATAFFTVVSLTTGYVIRRIFNRMEHDERVQ